MGRKFERILCSILICATADAGMFNPMPIPVAKKHHFDYAIKRAEAIDSSLKFHAAGGGVLSDDVFRQSEKQFLDKFKAAAKSRKQRQSYNIYKNDNKLNWVFKPQAFNQLMRNGAFKKLKDEVYRGDLIRARKAFIEHLEGLGIIHYQTYTNKHGEEIRIPNVWELNSNLFPCPKK